MEAMAQKMVKHVHHCVKEAAQNTARSEEAWESVRVMMDTWDEAMTMAPVDMVPTLSRCQATVEDAVFLAVTESYASAESVWPTIVDVLRLTDGITSSSRHSTTC